MNILGKRSDLPFSRKSDGKKEKSTASFMHVQNIVCSQTQLDGIAHEQTIICRQLFAGHMVGSRPMKRKKNLLWMIIRIISHNFSWVLPLWMSIDLFYFFPFYLIYYIYEVNLLVYLIFKSTGSWCQTTVIVNWIYKGKLMGENPTGISWSIWPSQGTVYHLVH